MKNLYRLFCASILFIAPQAQSAILNLSQSPLFTATYVTPNVFFQLDDSGSMDWESLAAPYWNFCAYDPNATGVYSPLTVCGSLVQSEGLLRSFGNGDYRYFTYIYKNSDNLYTDNCNSSSRNAIESCSEAGTSEWRLFSSDLNRTYYNPTATYNPWVGSCLTAGGACTDASFTAARSNPRQGSSGYTVTRNLAGSVYQIWIDDRGYNAADGRPLRGLALNATATGNGEVDLWDSHIKVQLNAADAKIYKSIYTPTVLSLGETQTLQATLTDTSACYNVLGTAALVKEVFKGNLAYTSTGQLGCRTINEAKTNYANWYQYQRRRSFIAKDAIGNVIKRFPEFRYGITVTNGTSNFFKEVPASNVTDYTTHNNNLITALYDFAWSPVNSPLRKGLSDAGEYFNNSLGGGKANPIIYSCQQNFTILFTDGYWNDISAPSFIGDNDNDGIAKTLADVARYYYLKDLSTLTNNVAPNAYDPATHQHMVTFGVGFGISGLLKDTDGDGWPNPALQVNGNWGNPFNSTPEKADDMWHATFNSKGFYLTGQSANEISVALAKILANITERTASAAPVAQNSTVLNTESQVYQSIFNTKNWNGDLLAYSIGLDGVLAETPTWSASCTLTGGNCLQTSSSNPVIPSDDRIIITRNWTGANNGIPFRWPSNYTSYKVSGALPTNLAGLLSQAPYAANTTNTAEITSNQTYGGYLVNYLRGDRAQELQNGGFYAFRNRASVLGDIVNSGPVYVAAPSRGYPDSLELSPYNTFKLAKANRTPIIYAGANDGMLHGFAASNGQEKLAYIPGSRQLYQNLPKLSIDPYQHVYFVDGSAAEGDVFYNSAWHTILTSTLGNGGQSLFALDITDPTQFTENNAANLYLFEFTDLDDPDFGYTQAIPIIAKVKTGTNQSKWAIIINNGYNSTQADGSASTTGKAALFIIFIEQGINGTWVADQNYIKIPVGSANLVTPNGLSGPYAVDIDGDYVVDYVYAGDIKGNMWKFDLRDPTPTNWKNNTSLLYTASFANAGDQPITAPPVVGAHPNGLSYGVMVYFGTGKYLENSDNSATNQITQSFYAIWDKLQGATVAKSALVQQTILSESTVNSSSFRTISSNPINYNTTPSPQNLGWYINLIVSGSSSNNGERQISPPILRNRNVIFTTMLPSSSVCEFGGSSWIMELDSTSGGAPAETPFDTNNDGAFNQQDYLAVTINGVSTPSKVGGIKTTSGITGTPAVMLTPDKSKEVKVTSGSQGLSSVLENPGQQQTGRQNWRQLY